MTIREKPQGAETFDAGAYQRAEERLCTCGAAGSGEGHTHWCSWMDSPWQRRGAIFDHEAASTDYVTNLDQIASLTTQLEQAKETLRRIANAGPHSAPKLLMLAAQATLAAIGPEPSHEDRELAKSLIAGARSDVAGS